jgi:putative flippase GtrA
VVSYHWAYAIAYGSGILLSYYLNSRFVFRRDSSFVGVAVYFFACFIQYCLGAALLEVLVETLNASPKYAIFIVATQSVAISFFVNKFIFKVFSDF